MRATLRSAYARTGYEAAGIVVRVGKHSAAMDALLRANGVRSAGFVTAWNPFSRRMPEGWNRRMLARLREAADGRVIAEGWGRADGWAEQHLLVAGDAAGIVVLARRFRQNAVVMVAPGRPARLSAVRIQPRMALDSSNIRFAFSTS
ncbi:DUF3293 domain-containing protein [Falsiroseomonas sp.]|uniref:DUF3293 domain-containing protein n=1 Tax=Falsiroseomonas sp. TaxID=2870721 RepID=UPI00356298DA